MLSKSLVIFVGIGVIAGLAFGVYLIDVKNVKEKIYGNFDEHMKWWKSRSEQIISEIDDKDAFLIDLKEELEKIKTEKGIPFDLSLLYINLKKK